MAGHRQDSTENSQTKKRRPQGFGAMDPELHRKIASKGGIAAHVKGTAHEYTPEEASAAGKIGGEKVSQNRDHMARIGRIGGSRSRGGGRRAKTPTS